MKTRIRELKDGAQEIIRLLSPDEMDAWSKDDPLSYEKSIVWLSDVSQLPFVRVKTVRAARSRRGPIYLGDGAHVVGYSKLTPNAPRNPESNGYIRRVFYLKSSDRAQVPTDIPHSAVDPKSILPGAAGELAKHAERSPVSRSRIEFSYWDDPHPSITVAVPAIRKKRSSILRVMARQAGLAHRVLTRVS